MVIRNQTVWILHGFGRYWTEFQRKLGVGEKGVKDNSSLEMRDQRQGTLKFDSRRLSQFLSETRFL